MSLLKKDNLLTSPKKRKKRKGLAINTTMGMNAKEKSQWRQRSKSGDVFETEGAFGDKVFVPKTQSDVDPAGSRLKNNLRLDRMQRFIERNRRKKGNKGNRIV